MINPSLIQFMERDLVKKTLFTISKFLLRLNNFFPIFLRFLNNCISLHFSKGEWKFRRLIVTDREGRSILFHKATRNRTTYVHDINKHKKREEISSSQRTTTDQRHRHIGIDCVWKRTLHPKTCRYKFRSSELKFICWKRLRKFNIASGKPREVFPSQDIF